MEQKLLNYIDKIAEILGKKNSFDIYDKDDIKQEIYFIFLDIEGSYDSTRSKDEFSYYYNAVKRRIKNLQRNKFINSKSLNSSEKLKIMSASEIRDDDKSYRSKDFDIIDFMDEHKAIVDKKIPAKLRADYLKLLEGLEIQYHSKMQIYSFIKSVVEAHNV